MRLWEFFLRRLLLLVAVVVSIMVLTFVLARLIPADPAYTYVGPLAKKEMVEAARKELGLDKSIPQQFAIYLRQVAHGDWGTSFRTHQPVVQDIRRFVPISMELVLLAMGLATVTGVLLGALSARYRGTWFDHLIRLLSISGVSISSFFLGLILQIIFHRWLGWLPAAERLDGMLAQIHAVPSVTGALLLDSLLAGDLTVFQDALKHIILPVLTIAAYPIGTIARMTRSAMLDVLSLEYIGAARAQGIPEWEITFRYALKNALTPVLTVVGLTFAYALTGTFFVEVIFNWPGLGTYVVSAVQAFDYPAISAITMVVAAAYVLINLVVDLIQLWLDPRITLQ